MVKMINMEIKNLNDKFSLTNILKKWSLWCVHDESHFMIGCYQLIYFLFLKFCAGYFQYRFIIS